nr:type I-E CRISPR-associated protein Cse1/CasA [Frankia sp. ACN10a]
MHSELCSHRTQSIGAICCAIGYVIVKDRRVVAIVGEVGAPRAVATTDPGEATRRVPELSVGLDRPVCAGRSISDGGGRMGRFDLVEQPWIPVMAEGERVEVGIRRALVEAHLFDGFAVDDPLEVVAVLRQVLLPVLIDACGAPRDREEWSSWWEDGEFCDERLKQLGKYFKHHAVDCFDLFHPERPFAQVAGLRTAKGETKPVSLLIPRLAAGNNVPLFSARAESDPPALTPARAARALLSVHCWDTAAIKSGAVDDPAVKAGKTTGNPTGPVGQLGVIVPFGATLFHTLLLNLPILPQGVNPGDRPQWRAGAAAGPGWSSRGARGLLDLLTWQARRVRLVAELEDAAPGGVVVRQVVLAAGDRLRGSAHEVEPHTAWRQVDKPKSDEPPQRPVRHQPGRSAWRGLEALLATSSPTSDRVSSSALLTQLAALRLDEYVAEDLPLRVLTVGVRYGNQSAVIEDVMSDEIPLPVTALTENTEVRDVVLTVARQAEDLRIAANRLGDDLRAAVGADKLPWDRGQRLGDVLVHLLTPTVRRLLAGLALHPGDADGAEQAWRIVARRLAWEVADPVLSAAEPATFLGREPEQRFGPRLANAEASFRRSLNNILGRPVTTQGRPNGEAAA